MISAEPCLQVNYPELNKPPNDTLSMGFTISNTLDVYKSKYS